MMPATLGLNALFDLLLCRTVVLHTASLYLTLADSHEVVYVGEIRNHQMNIGQSVMRGLLMLGRMLSKPSVISCDMS